jgi:GT2 family glycosyltransferase
MGLWLTRLEVTLERLVSCLPRQLVPLTSRILAGIDPLDPGRGQYLATGPAPRFLWSFPALRGGWYLLDLKIRRPDRSRRSLLGEAGATIAIPSTLRGDIGEVLRLPPGGQELVWQPAEAAGFFTQTAPVLIRIGTLEAMARMGWRVVSDLWRLRHQPPPARAGLRWAEALTCLPRAYRRTAAWRLEPAGLAQNYAAWLARYGTPRLPPLAGGPRFSLVIDGAGASPAALRASCDALLGQRYSDWELCLCAPRPADGPDDPRLKWMATATADQALEACTGAFVALLRPGDRLVPKALAALAACLARRPGLAMIYTDADEQAAPGDPAVPDFRPDYDPDLLLAYDYVSGLALLRTGLLRAARGDPVPGAEAWDWALSVSDRAGAAGIAHLPFPLLHRAGSPPVAPPAAARVLARHLERRGIAARAEFLPASASFRLHHRLPDPPPAVTLVMPTRNNAAMLQRCLTSLLDLTDYPAFSVLVVDNGSDDPATLAVLAGMAAKPGLRVSRDPAPFNFAALNNRAMAQVDTPFVLLINDDVEALEPGWLREMVAQGLRPGVGVVGAALWYPNGRLQHGGVVLGIGGGAGHVFKLSSPGEPGYPRRLAAVQRWSAVTAACMLVRREVYRAVGGLDERFVVAYNDVDFCLRVGAAGWTVLWTPFANLCHHESMSRGLNDSLAKRKRETSEQAAFRRRWGERLSHDPAYNPNLGLQIEQVMLAWPPRARERM